MHESVDCDKHPTRGRSGALLCVPLCLLALLCACDAAERPKHPPFLLLERDGYQALYGADGHLDRILRDRNGDRRADTIVYYDARGRAIRSEVDTDLDGAVDHWERMLDAGRWIEENDLDGDGVPDVRFLRVPGEPAAPMPPAAREQPGGEPAAAAAQN